MNQNQRKIRCGSARLVKERIERNDPWYTSSQFKWADKPQIRRIYQKRYEFFDECIERAKTRLGANLRLLDIGCGDGYWLNRLKHIAGLELMGIDYNPLRVQRARTLLPQVPIECIDLNDFETEKLFDVVLLNQVIEHIEDDAAVLEKTRTLLRQGGILILGTPNEGSIFQKRRLMKGNLETDHKHFYTEKEIQKKINEAGYNIKTVHREVFYFFCDRLYYGLLQYELGFRFLEFLTYIFPRHCSDYYFECVASTAEAQPSNNYADKHRFSYAT